MWSMSKQKLIVVSFEVLVLVVTTKPTISQEVNNTILPGCQQRCGDVKIPYPFGTTSDCYYDKSFRLTCNHSLNPPKTTFHGSNVSILEISVDRSEIRVETNVSYDCYDKHGKILKNESSPNSYTVTNSSFPLSMRNKFTAVGCDTLGIVAGYEGRYYTTACVALCDKANDVVDDSCGGTGCCQMDVPQGVSDFVTIVLSLDPKTNHSNVHNFNPCGFAFVAAEDAYNFSTLDMKTLRSKKSFPVVLDWAIATGNLTCEQAKRNLSGYACRAQNSECENSTNGPGYRCKCLRGYEGNPYLSNGCQDIDECERSNPCSIECHNLAGGYKCSCPKGFKGDGKRDGTGCSHDTSVKPVVRAALALVISTSLLILITLGSSWIYWGAKKRRLIKLKEKFFQQNGGLLLQQQLVSGQIETAKIFSDEELRKATNNFDQSRVIGRGGSGTVYKGVLTDNKVVAIKKSRIGDQSQIEQFINEVVVLSQINHRNVVKLLGCCLETKVPLLVYEFITNGTLFDHIRNKLSHYSSLSWEMRIKIATETARAIAYLHSSTSMPIIHRDIKTTNILLDDNYITKVSDFGASRLVPIDQTQLTTLVQGTLGYLDPEYFHTSQLTEKSDVYSFGVVLAELLTGQKALSFDRPEGDRNLALYFISSMKEDQLLQILDHDLATVEENIETIRIVASLAKACLRVRGEERPTMKEVASELEGLIHKEVHPWGQDVLSREETEYLLKSSDLYMVENDYGGNCSYSTAARIESMNNEMLQSYRDGR